jgi:hypothetical protein
MKLRFKIKHLMWLTLWTALILWVREPLIATAPELVDLLFWVSGIVALGVFVGLYGIALIADEGHFKDDLVNRMCYLLIADGIVFFVFSVVDDRLKS